MFRPIMESETMDMVREIQEDGKKGVFHQESANFAMLMSIAVSLARIADIMSTEYNEREGK